MVNKNIYQFVVDKSKYRNYSIAHGCNLLNFCSTQPIGDEMKVTTDLLRQWNACTDGYGWFIRKFPQGADYGVVQQALREDNRFDDSAWLTERAYATLLDDTSITKEITADAKAASDKVIQETTAISVDATKVDSNVASDGGGYGARIGSSGDDAQIGSSGYGARIVADGDNAVIACAGL
ncbi:MAG: hypothetical protein KGL35_08775, partial [Bradyrhizobium sp.]|nr:hypothetical protein [Bradyrhizobium sp.]